MYHVRIEKECGCFKRSGMNQVKAFDNKDDALIEAQEWADEMNETFCKKHNFSILEDGNDFIIKVEMKFFHRSLQSFVVGLGTPTYLRKARNPRHR